MEDAEAIRNDPYMQRIQKLFQNDKIYEKTT